MAAPEMGRNLRQLVDNSFEESQFESAVSTLDQLRSPDHIPSPIHILHLLFISLHPTTHSCRLDDPTEQILDHRALLQQSPRKMIKQTKSSLLLLSPTAVLASTRVLHAFLRTNGPHAFVHALPFYPESKIIPPLDLEYVDSPIYNQAVAIKGARSVWDVLKSGFTTRVTKAVPPPPKGRGKQPRALGLARDTSFTATSLTDWSAQEDIKPVGEDSWLVLDWLVSLFEADSQRSSLPKHSVLLLKQLPPPPMGTYTRWDASEPLKVVFYAFKQQDTRRQRTGLRLLLLLIELAQTPYLNLPSFASTVLAQLSAASSSESSNPSTTNTSPTSSPKPSATVSSTSPDPQTPPPPETYTPQKALTQLLTLLPSTPPCLAFKMTLCKKILASLDDESASLVPPPPLGVSSSSSWNSASFGYTSSFGYGGGVGMTSSGVGGYANMQVNAAAAAVVGAANSGGVVVNGSAIPNAKPRPRPRPVMKKKAVAVDDANDDSGVPNDNKDTEKDKEKDSTTTTAVAPAPATVPAPAPAPAPVSAPAPAPLPAPAPVQIQIPLPPLSEITRLLRLAPRPPLPPLPPLSPSHPPPAPAPSRSSRSSSRPPAPTSRAHPRARAQVQENNTGTETETDTEAGTQTPQTQQQQQSPWTTPRALLVRVKFEFVMAWMGVWRGRREGGEGKEKEELMNLINEIFADGGGTGEGTEDMAFYRQILSAFAAI